MAAPRNYLYHLITRVAPNRAELAAEMAESLLLGSVRATLAVQSRTHRSIEHRCEESGILCPPSRYRADDNENEVYTGNERNKGRRKRGCLFFNLDFLLSWYINLLAFIAVMFKQLLLKNKLKEIQNLYYFN